MRKPQFEIGEEVQWISGPGNGQMKGKIVDGPFEKGLRCVDSAWSYLDYTYLVNFPGPRILGEGSLRATKSPWQPCPGEHRRADDGWVRREAAGEEQG
ncbi:hypothetical protein LCGC14_2247990 [marine sediment metagenome]|uniref:Uncharacterized protein n=1 Tax=marine sediment metagenome TaxID=412755 RepID=A0A0F9D360_9ZZZZ